MLALHGHPLFNLNMLDELNAMTMSCPRFSGARVGRPAFTDLDDSGYVLTLKAPGVAKDKIKMTARDSVLTLEIGESTQWRLRIPRDAAVEKAHATHIDGILTVTFPKKELEGEHEGVTCDRSGMAPIRGKRYHLPHHNFDLCQAEFDKLGEREKALYECILPPPKRVRLDVAVAAEADTTPSEEEDEAETEAGEKPRPYSFTLNAAGVRPADLHVAIDDALLAVRGETAATGARLAHRVFRLPRDADAEKARAASVDGLLTVTIPRKLFETTAIAIDGPEGAAVEGAAAEAPAAAGSGEEKDGDAADGEAADMAD